MIPLQLRISGFLSYRDPVEIDFTTFDLACISGQNGAGKSSLPDAMTWVLFGQARKRDGKQPMICFIIVHCAEDFFDRRLSCWNFTDLHS